jgi:hypothetical protein
LGSTRYLTRINNIVWNKISPLLWAELWMLLGQIAPSSKTFFGVSCGQDTSRTGSAVLQSKFWWWILQFMCVYIYIYIYIYKITQEKLAPRKRGNAGRRLAAGEDGRSQGHLVSARCDHFHRGTSWTSLLPRKLRVSLPSSYNSVHMEHRTLLQVPLLVQKV